MSPNKNTSPVAFIIFCRPEYTKKVFAEIWAWWPQQPFVVANGLRTPTGVTLSKEYGHAFYEKIFRSQVTLIRQQIRRWIKSDTVHFERLKWYYRVFITYRNKVRRRLYGTVTIHTKTQRRGTVLLSYLTGPFSLLPWQRFTDPHTNYWECSEIARLFSMRGYEVDVIDASNTSFMPRKPYNVVVDVRQNLERWCTASANGTSPLQASCKKVMHITSSESGFQNAAEAARLADLKQRHGVIIPAQRVEAGLNNPAYADFLEGFGNKTVHATFARFNKPIRHIPISVTQTFEISEISSKNFAEARKHFLFFSGGGAILKGLDLVVEAFATMPDLHLHIVGPATYEKEFRSTYAQELTLPNISCYPRPRIDKAGDMVVGNTTFIAIANTCATLIYPSASEGTSGAVIQAMHAGVFPIVTKQTGLLEEAPAIILEKPTVDSICRQARAIEKTAPETLEKMARAAWNYVREHHTKEHFSFAYGQFIDDILRP
ncbi:MAG: glycosyltransferase [bacterium]